MDKNLDKKGRWRDKIVSFRVSPEEGEQLNKLSKLSGLTKQDYLIKKVLQQDVVVNGNPRVYKALYLQFCEVLDELSRLEKVTSDNSELIELIAYMATIMNGLKGDVDG